MGTIHIEAEHVISRLTVENQSYTDRMMGWKKTALQHLN